jgi:hypothetical protein
MLTFFSAFTFPFLAFFSSKVSSRRRSKLTVVVPGTSLPTHVNKVEMYEQSSRMRHGGYNHSNMLNGTRRGLEVLEQVSSNLVRIQWEVLSLTT